MKKLALAKASRPLAQYASELTDILIVTEGNLPLAVLIPLKTLDRESMALSTHPEFMKLMKRARKEFDSGRTLTLDQMRTRVRRMRSPGGVPRPVTGTRRRGATKRKRSLKGG